LKQKLAERKPVDLKLSAVKPLVKLYDHLKSRPEIIRNGFEEAGMTGCFGDAAKLFPNLPIVC